MIDLDSIYRNANSNKPAQQKNIKLVTTSLTKHK